MPNLTGVLAKKDLTDMYTPPGTSTATGAPPRLPGYGAGGGTGSLEEMDQRNIGFLLNPSFDTSEIDRNAAEKSLGAGVGGSGFGGNQRLKMLDSERISRFKLGHEILDPYLNRQHQTQLQSQAEAARMNQIAAEGAQALQRLQLSEAGLSARLSESERAEMERLVQQGQQAQQLAAINNAAELGRTRTQIGGNLANTYISGLMANERAGGGAAAGAAASQRVRGQIGPNDSSTGTNYLYGTGSFNPDATGNFDAFGNPMSAPRVPGIASNGIGSIAGGDASVRTEIQDILRRYGGG